MQRLFLLVVLAVSLVGCAQVAEFKGKGLDVMRDRIAAYCASTPESEREFLRNQLVGSTGLPLAEVHCENL